MDKFTQLTGVAAPLPIVNVDTDMIIPKDYLKTIKRTGLAEGLFAEMRLNEDGSENPDFVLNKPAYREATILVAGDNFGCGSSREHAPWALDDYGFRAILAPSYADIFFNNCFKNGLLPVILDEKIVDQLFQEMYDNEAYQLTVDLEKQVVATPSGQTFSFEIDEFRRHCLLKGLDDIGLTLEDTEAIRTYETRRRQSAPWLFDAIKSAS